MYYYYYFYIWDIVIVIIINKLLLINNQNIILISFLNVYRLIRYFTQQLRDSPIEGFSNMSVCLEGNYNPWTVLLYAICCTYGSEKSYSLLSVRTSTRRN